MVILPGLVGSPLQKHSILGWHLGWMAPEVTANIRGLMEVLQIYWQQGAMRGPCGSS